MSCIRVAAAFVALAAGPGLGAAGPTLDVVFDRPQRLTLGGAQIAIEGDFRDGFWSYGKKGLSIPAEGLLGGQGTLVFRFRASEFREEPLRARYLLTLRNAGRVFFGPYLLDGGRKLLVAVCDLDRDIRRYPVLSEDIRKDRPYTFAAAWDGASLRLYLDGVLVEEMKQEFPMPETFRAIHLGPFQDGWFDPPPWGDDSHAGFLKTYPAALSAEEIAALSGAVLRPAAEEYPQTLVVGRVPGAPPVVDGALSDPAWENAGGMIGFTDGRNGPNSWALPPSFFLVTYDEAALYLALETVFPAGASVREGAPRDPGETDVWGTESFEFYLQVDGALYRFGGNVAGGFVESKDMDTAYSGPWTYRSRTSIRVDDRRLWQAEAAIPWGSLGLGGPPAVPVRFNVCRSWFLAEVSTWSSLTPDGQYQTVAAFPTLVFAPAAPALRVREQNDPGTGRFRQRVQVAAARAGEAQYRILLARKDGAARPRTIFGGTVAFAPGAPAFCDVDVPVTRPGFDCLVFLLAEAGRPVLCQVLPFHLREEYLDVRPRFLKGFLEVRTRAEQLEARFGAGFRGRLRVTGPDGTVLAQRDASAQGEDRIEFPRSRPAGAYTVELLHAGDGSRVDARTIHYPGVGEWERQPFDPQRIVPPFAPLEVRASEGRFEAVVWGRSYQWRNSLLPSQILTQGEPLLAAPAAFEVGGQTLPPAEFVPGLCAPHRAEFTARVRTDACELVETAWVEYDGVQHGTFALTALRDLAGVRVRVALPGPRAVFLHTSYDQHWGAKRTERLGPGERRTFRFYPSVWVGDHERGLCIFAESNAAWKGPADSAFALTHEGATAVLTATLADRLKAGETLPFDLGLVATPVRPLPRNYPLDTFSDQYSAAMNRPGRRPTACIVLADWSWAGLGGFFGDLPSPGDSPVAAGVARVAAIARERGARVVPYMMARFLSEEYPEVTAFKESWRVSPEQTLDYERDGRRFAVTEICAFSSGCDFFLWKLRDFLRRVPCDGVYYDFGLPPWCSNPEHGCHGRSTLLGNREFLRRTALCLLESGVEEPVIVLHNTDSVMVPAFTFATHLFNGEHIRQHSSTLMHNGKDLLDTYDATPFASELSSLPFGLTNSVYHAQDLLLPEFGGTGEDPDLYKFRLTRAVLAGVLPHNTIPSISRCHFGFYDKIVRIYDAFGVPEADFFGYWRGPAVVRGGRDIYVSVYRHASRRKALAVISHIGREHTDQEAEIEFRPEILEMKPFSSAREMLTAQDPDYEELDNLLRAAPDVPHRGTQAVRTPIRLGDFGVAVAGIRDGVLRMRLAYHSVALVELE